MLLKRSIDLVHKGESGQSGTMSRPQDVKFKVRITSLISHFSTPPTILFHGLDLRSIFPGQKYNWNHTIWGDTMKMGINGLNKAILNLSHSCSMFFEYCKEIAFLTPINIVMAHTMSWLACWCTKIYKILRTGQNT